jgi:DNA invertase Pin-like site-specific DNA recombinase
MVTYLERFTATGVAVKSHQESWLDTESPVTDLLLAVFAWVARRERERIQGRPRPRARSRDAVRLSAGHSRREHGRAAPR